MSAETLWPQQAVFVFAFSPLYWRFGVRREKYEHWESGYKGMCTVGWKIVIAQFGPLSVRFGAMPIINSYGAGPPPRPSGDLK